MDWQRGMNRRTILKTIGAATIGGTALSGGASAHEPENRRHDTYTWANNEVWEMLEAEPGLRGATDVEFDQDSEGDHQGQRPIWIIAAHPTDPHSPHPNPSGAPVDHVVDLEPGKQFFSAQWHIHLILDGDNPFVCVEKCETEDPVMVPNFANEGSSGLLTSADRIRTAVSNREVTEIPVDAAFTCPVRPHHD